MAVLVLDGESRAAVEVVQSLGRAGVEVDVCVEDRAALVARSRYVRRVLRQPRKIPALLEWLGPLESRYELIVTSTENSLQAFRELPQECELYRKSLLAPKHSLEIALNKEATWERARSLGIPVPQSRLIEQGAAAPPPEQVPCVLKPLRSVVQQAGRSLRLAPVIVRGPEDRERHLARLLPLTAVQEQSYVSGSGVGVECLYQHGLLQWCFVHERVHELPLTGGGSSYRRSIAPDARVVEMTRKLLDSLGWHGVAMVEYKRSPEGEWYLVEINPRLWGSLALAIDAGVEFPLGMWRMARGLSVGPQPRYRVGYYSRHLPSDIDWLKANLRADHRDPLLLTRPRLASLIEYLRPLTFTESWDHFDWRDLRPTLVQLAQIFSQHLDGSRGRIIRALQRLRLRRHHERIARELDARRLEVRRVLFLCYGNICRSPFAEVCAAGIFNGVVVDSAGFHESRGRRSPDHIRRGAAELGLRLEGHRSKRVDAEMVRLADLVIVMDIENYIELTKHFPQAVAKTTSLGLFIGRHACEIPDPYTFDLDATREVLRTIREAVAAMAQRIRAVVS